MRADVSRATPRWVNVADVLSVAFLLFALAVFVSGGIRREVFGVFVSLTSAGRVLVWAVVIVALRHLVARRPSLPWRVWQALRRLKNEFKRLTTWLRAQPPIEDDVVRPAAARSGAAAAALEVVGVVIVMAALTLVTRAAQVRNLDGVTDLGDPVFSVWRLAWVAHQLAHDPLHLFDANIMHPSRFALAFSDSLLLPNVVAAPLVWLGMRPITVHSLWLLASFVLAGACMYLFVRAATKNRAAAAVAGVAFAFYPYRFDQYCHFEQMFSFWMPLALWSLHRTITGGRLRDGLLTGAAIAAQYLSGMYLGAFFVVWLVPVWLVLALGHHAWRGSLKPLAAGAVLAAVLVAPTVPSHLAARNAVGERTRFDVAAYSAQPRAYLVPGAARVTYRDTLGRAPHEAEGDLFPGVLIVVLALVALWPPLSVSRVAYIVALVVAFDASLGVHGFLFPALYNLLVPFRAFRVPARFSMLVGLSLALLAGFGMARLTARVRRPALRGALTVAVCFALLWEGRVALELEPIYQTVPGVYSFFDSRPESVIAVLPAPPVGTALQNFECAYMYYSTFHWHRLVNGYSGAWPRDYFEWRDEMLRFPTDAGVKMLRDRGVEYLVVLEGFYGHVPYREVIAGIEARTDFKEVARSLERRSEARVYQLMR
ncbi:MAG: hypothetical protein ACM3NQ_09270 [Bacteroidales bacterium]